VAVTVVARGHDEFEGAHEYPASAASSSSSAAAAAPAGNRADRLLFQICQG
jgi:hypothetical protein